MGRPRDVEVFREVSELQRGVPRYIFINILVSATAEAMTGCAAS